MTEKDIQITLYLKYTNHIYMIPNIFYFCGEEADLLSIAPSHYIYEFEIKLTLSDFKADFIKSKHKYYSKEMKIFAPEKRYSMPNRFFYVCPENVIPLELIPKYAGLIYISKGKYSNIVCHIKNAPLIHKEKLNERILLKMISCLSHKVWNCIFKENE